MKTIKTKQTAIPWLGEIPESWEVRKLKYSIYLNKWTEVNQIDKKVALENIESWTGRYIKTDGDFQDDGNIIKPGDVLFGKLNPYLAKVLLSDFYGRCVNTILVFTPNNKKITSNFLFRLCLSHKFINIVNSSTYGSIMPYAEWGFIGNLFIPLPPLQTQKEIVAHIEKESATIDTAISKIEEQIKLIEEYKKSLIYHAVTGKIAKLI